MKALRDFLVIHLLRFIIFSQYVPQARNHECTVLLRTLGSGALQLLVAEVSTTTTNTKKIKDDNI